MAVSCVFPIEVLLISRRRRWQIIDLSHQTLAKASKVYAQGLLMEIPPGSTESLENLTESLYIHLQIFLRQPSNRQIWLAKTDEAIIGLIDFYHNPEDVTVRFICAVPPQQGTGTQLLRQLAEYCQAHKITVIKTTVSSHDERACKFYFDRLCFQKSGTRSEESGIELFLAESQPDELLERIASILKS
ncbi:MAG: GNAT family N-acetyltransferase [Candidatus Thorarchaeota archaeon]